MVVSEAQVTASTATPSADQIPGLVSPESSKANRAPAAGDADSQPFLIDIEKGRGTLVSLIKMSEQLGPRARELLGAKLPRIFDAYNAMQIEVDNLRVDLDERREASAGKRAKACPGDGWVRTGSISAPSERLDEAFIAEAGADLRELTSTLERAGSEKLIGNLELIELGYLQLQEDIDQLRDEIAAMGSRKKRARTPTRAKNKGKLDLEQFALTPEQVQFYQDNGYLGPLTLCSEEDMGRIRRWIDRTGFLHQPSPVYKNVKGGRVLRDWHLVYREMFELATHPAVVEAMASVFGPDLILWRSQFMWKGPGGKPVAWHQDGAFPGSGMLPALNPGKNISAWIAIDESKLENGCVRFVPGTHKEELEYKAEIAEQGGGLFQRGYQLQYVADQGKVVSMILKPGQFMLFDCQTLHGSTHNPSNQRRLGLSVRVTTPDVKVYEGQDVDGQGFDLANFGCVLIRGQDRHGYNVMCDPPDPI